MSGLFCGIDIGSTNVKVVLADEDGRAVHTAAVPTPRVSDGIGPTTDAAALVTLLEEMIVAGWRAAGRGIPIGAIAAAGVGEDGLGVDADLRPTGLSLPWFDARATGEAEEMRQSPGVTPRSGIAIGPDRTAAKWLWLRRERPNELRAARHWIALTDYPAAWWSGTPFMSGTLAPRTACYDVYARQWIDPLLAAAGAPPLPGLRVAGTPVGTMRPGPLVASGAASAETLLVTGGHDHPVAADAIRGIAPGARVDSMGTANLIYGEARGPAAPYLDPFMAFSTPPSGEPGLACLGVMELSAALVSGRGDRERLRLLLDGVRLPGAPLADADDRGSDRDTEVRRTLERATFHARRMLAAMDAAGAPPGPIYATGGWSRSRAFLELRASIFGQPVHVVDEPELTAIGAAFLAARATAGAGPSLAATRTVGVVDPIADWIDAYEAVAPGVMQWLDAEANRQTKEPVAAAPDGRTDHGRH